MTIEAYSNQVEIPGIASVIHEDVLNQATYGNHCELSATTILAVYNDVTNSKGMVRIGTRVSDFSIEWGNPVEFSNGSCKHLIPVRISDTKFAIVYVQTNDDDGYIIAGTAAGTVPTLGSEVEFADAVTCTPIGAVLMTTDKVMIAYQDATTNQKAVMASMSGTTVTIGTAATINSTIDSAAYTSLTQLCMHSATLASVAYRVSATVTEVVTLSLSDTTITVNTAGKAAFGGSADIRYPSIVALSATAFVVAYTDVTDTNKGNAQIGTISGTTITAGASEYNFDATNYATRKPSVAVISSTIFAIIYSPNSSSSIYAVVATVASTVITFGSTLQVAVNNGYNYPYVSPSTPLCITYTKSGQLTFSYLGAYLNQFVCGMLSYVSTSVEYVNMCAKIATAGVGEQVELSSVYLKSNSYGYKVATDIGQDYTASLYLNGTLDSNKIYSTSDVYMSTSSVSIREVARVGMANEPIILKSGESLYASVDTFQIGLKKGSCTVFGLKRS